MLLNEMSESLQKGKAKDVKALVQQAIEEGYSPKEILDKGLLSGMEVIGSKFKNNEVFVPEVLIAARAMNAGMQVLESLLAETGAKAIGKAVIRTVKEDLHDIGKNLVAMLLKGSGFDVIDIGTDVDSETFIEKAEEENADIICMSALLTTTMGKMKEVIDMLNEKGLRDKYIVMVGGAPINDAFCKMIGADKYSPDAASAAEEAKRLIIDRNQMA